MNEARVAYTSRPDATTVEGELDVLASIYKRAIEAYELRKAAHPGGPHDAKEIEDDCADTASIQED